MCRLEEPSCCDRRMESTHPSARSSWSAGDPSLVPMLFVLCCRKRIKIKKCVTWSSFFRFFICFFFLVGLFHSLETMSSLKNDYIIRDHCIFSDADISVDVDIGYVFRKLGKKHLSQAIQCLLFRFHLNVDSCEPENTRHRITFNRVDDLKDPTDPNDGKHSIKCSNSPAEIEIPIELLLSGDINTKRESVQSYLHELLAYDSNRRLCHQQEGPRNRADCLFPDMFIQCQPITDPREVNFRVFLKPHRLDLDFVQKEGSRSFREDAVVRYTPFDGIFISFVLQR